MGPICPFSLPLVRDAAMRPWPVGQPERSMAAERQGYSLSLRHKRVRHACKIDTGFCKYCKAPFHSRSNCSSRAKPLDIIKRRKALPVRLTRARVRPGRVAHAAALQSRGKAASNPYDAKSKCVADDRNGTQAHRRRRDDRAEQDSKSRVEHAGRERNTQDVINKRQH